MKNHTLFRRRRRRKRLFFLFR